MLLMALLNEHLMTFNQYKDAKSLFDAITTRFGRNDATRKTQKTLLQQMYENFSESISHEDLNLKFLRILPSEWNTHVVVWRNKSDLDKISIDDLYNNFKIAKQEVKMNDGLSSSSGSQNMVFVSTPCTSNNDDVSTVFGVSTASPHVTTTNLSDATIVPKNQENITRNQETTKRIMNVEDTSSKAMLAIDGADVDWSYMADDEAPTNMAFMAFSDSKKFENASQSLDKLIGSQIADKSKRGLGYVSYNAVLPPHTVRFSPLRIDLSHTGLLEFADPSVECYGVKPIKVESEGEDEVESLPEIERKTIEASMDNVEVDIPKQNNKPARRLVKYAEMYITQRPRGIQRNWNNLKSHQLGSNFVIYNKACYAFRSFNQLQARCKYHQRERMVNETNHSRVNHSANTVPKAMLPRTGLKAVNTVRPINPKSTRRSFQRTTAYNNRKFS
nr:ribonuclease H-like domain-containing protein [Tanacetum cinerariifolium]